MSSVRSRGSCVSIADTSGQLLFYAYTRYGMSGNTTLVMNKNNQIMQNRSNIVGEGWYTELIIIPYANQNDLYYLFSISVTGSSQLGLYYSVIDMSMNGGLGIVTQKNMQLSNLQSVDGIQAIRHSNGRDWWLLFLPWPVNPSNEFQTFLIDTNGISGPIIQTVGSNRVGVSDGIAFTQNGTRFYLKTHFGLVERYDFDRCSGVISNPLNIEPESNGNFYFGIAISKNDSILYLSNQNSNSHGYLFQYNLIAPNIATSRDTIFDFDYSIFPNNCVGQLRLAPDNKIYMTSTDWGTSSLYYDSMTYTPYNMNLGVINSPNYLGTPCNFQPFSFSLGGKRTYWSLPNNPNYDLGPLVNSPCYFSVNFSATDSICAGNCIDFTNYTLNANSYQWNFPGAIPNTSTDINPQSICYLNPGNYDVTLIASDATGSDTLTLTNYITVFPSPPQAITQIGDTLFAIPQAGTYQWYFNGIVINGATGSFYVAQQSGDYNVVHTDTNGCEVEAAVTNVVADVQSRIDNRQLTIFPNPVTDKFTIPANLFEPEKPVDISIFNVPGEKLYHTIDYRREMDCGFLSPGMYILELISDSKIYRAKFVKN